VDAERLAIAPVQAHAEGTLTAAQTFEEYPQQAEQS